MFPLSRLVAAPRFLSISSLVLELRQFLFYKEFDIQKSEIQKSEIPPYEFFPISRDSRDLGIPNSA